MKIQSTKPPKISHHGKVARILIHPDGRQEFVFDNDDPAIKDIPTHPAFVAGATTFMAANKFAQMDHGKIINALDKSLPTIRPNNGWNNVATNIESLASDPNVQNIAVSVAAGAASYPVWLYILKKIGINSPKIAVWASVVVTVVVLIVLSIYSSPDVTKEQCNKGYSSYKSSLMEVEFNRACVKLLE